MKQYFSILLFVVFSVVALASNCAVAAEEIGRDGRFVAYSDGTVVDETNGLMWAAADNGEDINWTGAYLFCEEYAGGGYADWRLPTPEELSTLFVPGTANRDGLFTTDLLHLTTIMMWTDDQHACKARCMDFTSGRMLRLQGARLDLARALPVRTLSSK